MTDHMEVRRLILKVERASIDQLNLRTLLASADTALAALRRELRVARARGLRLTNRPLRPVRTR